MVPLNAEEWLLFGIMGVLGVIGLSLLYRKWRRAALRRKEKREPTTGIFGSRKPLCRVNESMSISDNAGHVKFFLGRTNPCTPESAPFRSS